MSEHVCAECGRMFRWGEDQDSPLGVSAGGSEPCGVNAYWKLQGHMQSEHLDSGFLCPRRGEGSFHWPGSDYWTMRDGYRACTYCGSMHPDDLFKAIDDNAHIGGTDNNYKIYVDLPQPNAGRPCVTSSSNKPSHGYELLTLERAEALGLDSYAVEHYVGQYVWIGKEDRVRAKFYFQHFDKAQQRQFLDLYNAKKLNLDQFGLYRLPFFAREVTPT